ncbi:MAG: hypothetical protein Q9169_006177 [Polycauliona sp. 2 TL-2023]
MADLVIRQAVANITGFGQHQQSTQHMDSADDKLQADRVPAPVQEPVAFSDDGTASPIGATAMTPATSTEHFNAARTPKPQATAAPTAFFRPVESSPAIEFSFGKAVIPTMNIKLTKGPAAEMQKKAEQQSSGPKPTPIAIQSVSSTDRNIPPKSQLEEPLQDHGSSHVARELHESYNAKGSEAQQSEAPIQQGPNAAQSLSSEIQEKALAKSDHTPYQSDEKNTDVPSKTSTENVSNNGQPASERLGLAPVTTQDAQNLEDTAMIDGPTLVNDEESDTTSSASSRPSSRSPSHGRSIRSFGATLSNRSFDQHSLDRSVLHKQRAASKVQKRRSSTGYRSLAPSESLQVRASDPAIDDPDVLLKALTVHYHRQKQQRDELRTKEKEKDDEIADFKNIVLVLDSQLQESNKQISSQEAKLLKYRQLIPGWQDKVKKLSNFVKGLNNDHARLRDDARCMHDEQQKIKVYKETITKTLAETSGALEIERLYQQKRLVKAHHRTEIAEQTLDSRNLDLQSKNISLRAEQERSTNLQKSLDKFASNRAGIVTQLANQESVITSKVAGLYETIADALREASTREHEDPIPKLDMCISLLKKPPAVDPVSVEDVKKLDISIKENGDEVSRLASLYQDHIESTSNLEDRLVSEFDFRLQSLSSDMKAGRPLEQQMHTLHQVKATITERLQATEVNLAESRQKLTVAENKDKAQLQKVAALEAEVKVLRAQPQESPLMALRLHESEKQCEELHRQASAYQVQLEDIKSDLASRCLEKSDLEDSLQATSAELAELRNTLHTVSLEKAAVDGQAKLNEDRLKQHFSTLCNDQISQNSDKFTKEIQRLRNVEKDLNASRTKISLLEATKKEALAKLDTATQDLESSKISENDASKKLQQYEKDKMRIEKEVGAMRHQDTEKSKHLQKIEIELGQLREQTSKARKDLEEHVRTEKASLLDNIKAAEASANNSQQLLAESRRQTSELHQENLDLRKRQVQQKELQEGLESVRAHFIQENQDLTAQLEVAEADKKRLREQNEALTAKSKSQEPHRGESVQKQALTVDKAKPVLKRGSQLSSTLKRQPATKTGSTALAAQKHRLNPTKKAAVVEDSQDRSGVIEESQYMSMQRLPSPELPSSTDPIGYMPKVIQDLVAAPSSPLTDPPTPSAAGRHAMKPSNHRGRVIDDSQAADLFSQELGSDLFSQELGSDYAPSSQHSVWTHTESTTKTKSRSVERSIVKSSQPVRAHPQQTQTGGKTMSPIHRTSNIQANHRMHNMLKPAFKRTAISQSQASSGDLQGSSKRRRISSQVSTTDDGRSNVGTTRVSPAKPAKLTRKSTRQSDKYHEKFQAEFKKGK